MVKSLKQISMNFQKADKAASYLNDASRFLYRFASNENDYILRNLKKNWTGENATAFSIKNEQLFFEMHDIAIQMNSEASRIKYKAAKLKAAEESAYAIAKEREKKG